LEHLCAFPAYVTTAPSGTVAEDTIDSCICKLNIYVLAV